MPSLRKRTVLLSLSALLENVGALATAIVLSWLLAKDVYGTYRQTFFVYRLLLGVLGLNIALSLLYFIPRAKREEHPAYVGQSVLLALGVGAVIGLIIAVGADFIGWATNNPKLVPLLYLMVPYAVLNQITRIMPNTLLSVDRPGLVLAHDAVAMIGRNTCIIVPFVLGVEVYWVIATVLAWEFLLAGGGMILVQMVIGIRFRGLDTSRLLEQLSYTWPLLATSIIATLNIQFDRAVIAAAFDSERFADYTNGAMKIPFVIIAVRALHRALLPEMARLARDGQIQPMMGLFRTGAVKGALVVFPVVVFFLLCPDYVVTLVYGDKYLLSSVPFAIYCAGLVIRVATYTSVFQAMGKNRLTVIGAVTAFAANAAVSLLLVFLGKHYYGPDSVLAFAGPAVGTVISTYLCNIVFIFLIARVTDCPVLKVLPLGALGKTMGAALAGAAAAVLFRWTPLPNLAKVACMAVTFSVIFLALTRRAGLISPRDVEFALGPVKRVLRGVANRLGRPKPPQS